VETIDQCWRKSSYSGNGGGNCVEVAADGALAVRDSNDPDGPVLRFPAEVWRDFTDKLRD
jgi:hypothetical protein